ncbi:alpha/beta hydrolase [Nocardioides sp. SOB77]|uniref:Alpha/beta hydrolase n=1 Tax=Nocardioides oceani TaxID=3058369 RepID=A0ABT8FDP6_9ACTN|nr:alpha/beta hydrolase [Nocardioides oceani]MDN4172808.1 alpha/beta hydrolase [Nocardioides oceani]
MPDITSNGITLHHRDTGGEGRPVVLIHGWPLSGASWAPQVSALTSAGYRVVEYDRRGFGASDKPESGYDYDTLAADLAGLLDALDLRDVALVGFSMGGGEVARYLATYGDERVAQAVLAAAVPPYLLQTPDNPDGGLSDAEVSDMQREVAEDRAAFLDDFTTGFFSVDGELKVTEEERRQALALQEPARDEALVACIDSFARTDFRADLEQIAVPTLVIHGDGDGVVPFEVSGKRSAEAIADSTLVVVEGAPHGLNVSHEREFNAALIDFLGS